jgi:hypothetical protein
LDVLIHLLLSETIFSPLPLRTAEISSVGGVSGSFLGQPIWPNVYVGIQCTNTGICLNKVSSYMTVLLSKPKSGSILTNYKLDY